MHKLIALFIVTTAVATTACGGGGGASIEGFIKLDADKSAAFAVGGDDCVAKAASVRAWRAAHNAEYKGIQASLKQKWPKGPPKEVMTKYGEQIAANKKVVVGAIAKCTGTPEFDAAIDDTK